MTIDETIQIAKLRRRARLLRAKAESSDFPAESTALVAKAQEIEAVLPPEPPSVKVVYRDRIIYRDMPIEAGRNETSTSVQVVVVRESGLFTGGVTARRAAERYPRDFIDPRKRR